MGQYKIIFVMSSFDKRLGLEVVLKSNAGQILIPLQSNKLKVKGFWHFSGPIL